MTEQLNYRASVTSQRPTYGTLNSALDRYKGVGPGFDLLRIGLAVAIFYGHAKWVAGSSVGPEVVAQALVHEGMTWDRAREAAFDWSLWGSFKRAYHLVLVPMFFALSGFLVSGSAVRVRELRPFLAFRALRIFPALTVEVVLSALLLGPLFTTLAAPNYFTDPKFYRYFGNILGFVYFVLPGVFANNPVQHVVNVNLWTLPAEFYCYLITSILIATGLFLKRSTFTLIVLGLTLAAIIGSLAADFSVTRKSIYDTPVVVYYFLVGCVFYQWKERVPFGWGYFTAALAVSLVTLALPRGVFIAPIFVTYCTVFLGAINWPRLPLLHHGDYSYGVYLYGFPISQALIASAPQLQGHENWFALFAGVLTFAFAAVSWTWIEKPTLRLKRYFSPRTVSK